MNKKGIKYNNLIPFFHLHYFIRITDKMSQYN